VNKALFLGLFLGQDLAIALTLGWIGHSVRAHTRASQTLADAFVKLVGGRLRMESAETRLADLEDLVQRAGWQVEANRQALERLGKRLADLEPWGQDNSDQVDDNDDDSTGDDLSDVPFTVVQTLPPVGGFLRRLSDAIPALTSSYSVVCPACETVNKSEGVPPVRCVGCQAELPERQWPF
jgi:hypothetical protein